MTEKEFKEAKIKPGDWVKLKGVVWASCQFAEVDCATEGKVYVNNGFSFLADNIERVYHPQFKVGDLVTLSVNKTHQIMTISRITEIVPGVYTSTENDGFAYHLEGCKDYFPSSSLVKLFDSTDTTGCRFTGVDISIDGNDWNGLTVIDRNDSIECGFVDSSPSGTLLKKREYESNLYKNWQLSAENCRPVTQAKVEDGAVLNIPTDETVIKKGITIKPRKKIKLNFKN